MDAQRRKAPAKAKKPNVVVSERVARQRVAIEQRREAEATAQRVVEELLEENGVPAEVFRRVGQFIDPPRYGDVVEERSEVQHVCGYPPCANILGKIKTQRYHISLADQKVYDITERKHFCSDACYKASKWYASQLSTEPVWARAQLRLPTIVLWNEKNRSSTEAAVGEAVDLVQGGQTLKNIITHMRSESDLDATLPELSIHEKEVVSNPSEKQESDPLLLDQENAESNSGDEDTDSFDSRVEEVVGSSGVMLSSSKQTCASAIPPLTGLALLRATLVRWSSASSRAFLRGEMTASFELREKDENEGEEMDDVEVDKSKRKEIKQTKKRERHIVYQRADAHRQQSLRLDIVLERLSKALPVVLTCLQLPRASVTSDLQQLLRCFTYSRDNIVFSPDQWLIILLAILKACSHQNSLLANAWEANHSRLLLLMQKLKVSIEDVHLLVETLTAVN